MSSKTSVADEADLWLFKEKVTVDAGKELAIEGQVVGLPLDLPADRFRPAAWKSPRP
jgi:hypothetical protein